VGPVTKPDPEHAADRQAVLLGEAQVPAARRRKGSREPFEERLAPGAEARAPSSLRVDSLERGDGAWVAVAIDPGPDALLLRLRDIAARQLVPAGPKRVGPTGELDDLRARGLEELSGLAQAPPGQRRPERSQPVRPEAVAARVQLDHDAARLAPDHGDLVEERLERAGKLGVPQRSVGYVQHGP